MAKKSKKTYMIITTSNGTVTHWRTKKGLEKALKEAMSDFSTTPTIEDRGDGWYEFRDGDKVVTLSPY